MRMQACRRRSFIGPSDRKERNHLILDAVGHPVMTGRHEERGGRKDGLCALSFYLLNSSTYFIAVAAAARAGASFLLMAARSQVWPAWLRPGLHDRGGPA